MPNKQIASNETRNSRFSEMFYEESQSKSKVDVNVLLNRVKLDQKKNFNKKLLFSTGIVLTISLIAVFVII